ncbi:hypothetical protein LR48_Vigan08g051400 [Vigna angularis]|uniref:Uncharacterized protein n=1 Tax=Phaseolus angularis TaxID=3914 RepID=A0A0L9V421_PHAAN|nr:hypothetical protein LR48_Vigan08g051400 [Vigna angularis]
MAINSPQINRPSSPDVTVVEEHPFVRKWKGEQAVEKPSSSKKMKDSQEPSDRLIPNGMRSSAFNLGHKIAFNMDEYEKKVVEGMTEQQMADTAMEFGCRTAMVNWHLAYASDRGVMRTEWKKVQTQLKRVITSLRKERDALLLTTVGDKEIMEEMGVDFDPRKDVYQGHLVSLSEIPEGALLESEPAETEENVVTKTPITREIREEDPIVPSTNAVDVVHVE